MDYKNQEEQLKNQYSSTNHLKISEISPEHSPDHRELNYQTEISQ